MMGIVEVCGDDILHVSDNPASAAFFETTPEATRGRFASALGVPEAHLSRWLGHYRQARADGAPVRFRYPHAGADGERWLEATVEHAAGDRYTYIVEEVTDRVRQEDTLRLAESRQGALLRALPDLIFRLTPDGRYLDVHAPDPDALVAPADKLRGQSIDAFLPAALAQRLHDALERTLVSGEVEELEYDLTTDGVDRRFEARLSPDTEHDEVLVIVRDVTEAHAARRSVGVTAERLRALVHNLEAAVLLEDEDRRLLATNDRFCETFGIPAQPQELVGADCKAALDAALPFFADPQTASDTVTERLAARERVLGERVGFADGRMMERDYIPIALHGDAGGHLWIYRDVTARVEAERRLRQRETHYRLLAENTRDLVALHATDGRYEWVSPSVTALLGYTPEQLVGTHPVDYLHPEDAAAALLRTHGGHAPPVEPQRVRHADGHYVWLETLTQPILDAGSDVVRLQSASRDVTDRREMEERLIHQAFHDPLTGLPNRELFQSRLEQALATEAAGLAVLFVDLDRFKVVNDTLGHSAGDQLLSAVARRLEAVARPTDTVARLGGDEFALLVQNLPASRDGEPSYGEIVAARVLDVLSTPVLVGGRPLFAGASVGVVTGRPDHETPDALLREADLAMYQAKQTGRGAAVLFSEADHGTLTQRLRLEMDLRYAVERGELFVMYQPLVRLSDGALTGFEALVRWQHPELGLLAPDAFLGPARDSGQLSAIDRWVLTEACRTAATWAAPRPGQPPLRVNVNCSGHDLLLPGYVDDVLGIVAEHALSPGRLALEITEQQLVHDADAVAERLRRLQAGGVRVSLDDFGTGYSSLATLHALPVDTVKVDRSFVSEMVASDRSHQLVEMVVHLGRILDKAVVAEGIEDATQLGALRTVGCAYGQGYLFDRPLSADRAGALALAEAPPWHTHWAVA